MNVCCQVIDFSSSLILIPFVCQLSDFDEILCEIHNHIFVCTHFRASEWVCERERGECDNAIIKL